MNFDHIFACLAPESRRIQLVETGYVPLPICFRGKAPYLPGWQNIEPSLDMVRSWSAEYPFDANTGLNTRTMPTFDIDIKNPEGAVAVESMVRERFGERGRILVRVGNAPKRAIPFRTDVPFKKLTQSFAGGEKFEFLGDGQQVVAFGWHKDLGKPYTWSGGEPGEIPFVELPEISQLEAQQLVDDATALLVEQYGYRLPEAKPNGAGAGAGGGEHVSNGDLLGLPGEVAAALGAIPNPPELGRDAWIRIGLATHAASAGSQEGFGAFDAWSKKHKSYNADNTREAWRGFKPNRIGAGTLFHLASEADPEWRSKCNAERQQEGARQAAGIGFGTQPQPKDPAWPTMRPEAYHGIAGQLVAAIEPHSESDPVATLIQFLTCFGNSVGKTKFYLAEATPHHTNLFVTLVGISSKGRKGTSFGHIRPVMTFCDADWVTNHLRDDGGLSSGEGLINVVRDPVEKWDPKEQQHYLADPGVEDKRLLLVEGEFASLLAAMERPGNTISPLIRKAWDDGNLSTLTRQSPLKATGAHISIIGHITNDELRARLTRTEMGNGFANRFLFMLVRRSKELPFGGNVDPAEIRRIGWSLSSMRSHAKEHSGRVNFSPAAAELWEAEYHDLSAAHPGLLGSITSRSEAQTVRLALIYALLDKSDVIDVSHLRAALAVQQYAFDSAASIFGQSLGDETADTILQALKNHPEGMTRTAISNLFSNHKERDKIRVALALLLAKGLARMETVKTRGASAEIWFATEVSK
jgi:hypothetical protein